MHVRLAFYRLSYTIGPVPIFIPSKQAPVFRFPKCSAGTSTFSFLCQHLVSPASVSPHILYLIWQRLLWVLISLFLRCEDCDPTKPQQRSGFWTLVSPFAHPTETHPSLTCCLEWFCLVLTCLCFCFYSLIIVSPNTSKSSSSVPRPEHLAKSLVGSCGYHVGLLLETRALMS